MSTMQQLPTMPGWVTKGKLSVPIQCLKKRPGKEPIPSQGCTACEYQTQCGTDKIRIRVPKL